MSAAEPPFPPPATDAASLPAGYSMHEYQIERSLGGGGFGITYLARDRNLDLPVAIKEYFPADLVTRAADQSVQVRRSANQDAQQTYDWGLERFLDEARVLATFRHPNIVRVLRYFRENGTAYIVMEYESGQSLKHWVPENAPLSQRSLLSILYPLMDGLEAVHKTGFLHRDIKPDNIYVRGDGTPVLLDFGAARRVSANRDITNIVTPGFAPFEQYHSQGNQGPWTDIYSLGAVVYWMTTGKKPVESAARVKNDTLLPASSLAEASIFGAALLQAVDWALHPDETRRPQNVGLLRAAILGSEKPEPGLSQEIRPATPGLGATAYASSHGPEAPGGPAGAQSASVASRRNVLCTIMFLDLVGYSVRSVDDQVALKRLFNEMMGKALKAVPEDTRIAIDTGDGAAICFMGDPEEALHCAMLLRDLLGQRYGSLLSLRIGLHLGPIRVIPDINGRVNVVGDGINAAQRVMDLSQPNQVVVSRAYYDVICRITDDTASLFENLGQFADKHGRLHELFGVAAHRGADKTQPAGRSAASIVTPPPLVRQPLEPHAVHEVETDLARHIGPLAKVLVRKAEPLASSIRELREALAVSIPEARARDLFIASSSHRFDHSRPLSQPVSQPVSQPLSRPHSEPLRPPTVGAGSPKTVAPGWRSATVALGATPLNERAPSVPAPTRQLELAEDEIALIEQALSRIIGPMARMLVRRQAGRNLTFNEFVEAVAGNIDQPQQRAVFIQTVRRALGTRH